MFNLRDRRDAEAEAQSASNVIEQILRAEFRPGMTKKAYRAACLARVRKLPDDERFHAEVELGVNSGKAGAWVAGATLDQAHDFLKAKTELVTTLCGLIRNGVGLTDEQLFNLARMWVGVDGPFAVEPLKSDLYWRDGMFEDPPGSGCWTAGPDVPIEYPDGADKPPHNGESLESWIQEARAIVAAGTP